MLERHPLSRLQRKSLDPLEVRRYNGEGTYIAIPKVTSERRKTIPLVGLPANRGHVVGLPSA